ncbi:MAG: hypothetical protein ABIO96_10380 [Nitrospiraceae bacterium]
MNRLILFLDFDAHDPLTSMVQRPNQTRLSRTVRETLRKLVGLLQVVVISRHASKDLRRRVGLQKVCYVGHHGLSHLEAGGDMTGKFSETYGVAAREQQAFEDLMSSLYQLEYCQVIGKF